MREASWPQVLLFGVGAFAGNVGLMMWTGFLPAPRGQWFSATVGALLLLCLQCFILICILEYIYSKEDPSEA